MEVRPDQDIPEFLQKPEFIVESFFLIPLSGGDSVLIWVDRIKKALWRD
jgi:hypothetical protein